MVALKYLPEVISLILVEYLIITAFVAWKTSAKYYEQIMIGDFDEIQINSTSCTSSCRKFFRSLANRKFYFAYFEGHCPNIATLSRSCWHEFSTKFTILLTITRLVFFVYFVGGTIYIYVYSHGASWIFFTNWNLLLISLFYLIASIHSVVGLYSEYVHKVDIIKNSINWKLYHAVHILFEVSASTAFFVTTVDFILLDSNFEFLNVTQHFLTSLSFLVEISLNSLPVYIEHIWIAITWMVVYVIYAWGMVGSGTLKYWPYDFMELGNPYCFLWYNVLFFVALLFYGMLILLDYAKRQLLTHVGLGEDVNALQPEMNGDEVAVMHSEFLSEEANAMHPAEF